MARQCPWQLHGKGGGSLWAFTSLCQGLWYLQGLYGVVEQSIERVSMISRCLKGCSLEGFGCLDDFRVRKGTLRASGAHDFHRISGQPFWTVASEPQFSKPRNYKGHYGYYWNNGIRGLFGLWVFAVSWR